MVILGVDPGTAVTGYGVIRYLDGGAEVLSCGVIRTDPKRAFPLRLKKIYDDLCGIIQQHRPDQLALEDVFYSKDVKMALRMGHARGVTLLAAVNHGLPTAEYSPREVKQALTGNGAASKEQIQRMVYDLLRLSALPQPFDIADALAVALCHCHRLSRKPEAGG